MESINLNAEALHEISRLQENILQTLKNELKKLKEPEVMGASIVSTPTHEIGEDMTPLPSIRGLTVSNLKPVRLFSPMSPKRRVRRKLKSTKKPVVDNYQSTKYNYKTRNYPRPWADPPMRRRTISEESLEVHVTSSHFSDLSNIEIPLRSEILEEQQRLASGGENVELQDLLAMDIASATSSSLVRKESSEIWKRSIIFKSKPSKVLKYPINSKTSLGNISNKGSSFQSQPHRTVNQHRKSPAAKCSPKTPRAVVFPPPVPESQKPKALGVSQYSSKYGLPLELFVLDETNNNVIEEVIPESYNKLLCSEKLYETQILCDVVYEKLMRSRSIQAICQKDETVQTDRIPESFSSEFELGIFIATLIDELIDAACAHSIPLNSTQQGTKSNSHNSSPQILASRCVAGASHRRTPNECNREGFHESNRRAINDSQIPVPTYRFSTKNLELRENQVKSAEKNTKNAQKETKYSPKNTINAQKEVLKSSQKDKLTVQKGTLNAQKDNLNAQKDKLNVQKDTLSAQDTFNAQKDTLNIKKEITKSAQRTTKNKAKELKISYKPQDSRPSNPNNFKGVNKQRVEQVVKSSKNNLKSIQKDSIVPSSRKIMKSSMITSPVVTRDDAEGSQATNPCPVIQLLDNDGAKCKVKGRSGGESPVTAMSTDVDISPRKALLGPGLEDQNNPECTKPRFACNLEEDIGVCGKPEEKQRQQRTGHCLRHQLETKRARSKKLKKKLWWLFNSDNSSIESVSIPSIKDWLPGETLMKREELVVGKDLEDSSGPDVYSKTEQSFCSSRMSMVKQSHLKTGRKRNIKMSYHPPDFADLFPYAGTILAEASHFMPKLNPNLAATNSTCERCWKNVAIVNNRLTPLLNKFTR